MTGLIDVLVIALIFIVAFSMTLVGKGGGNFYVVILILAAIPIPRGNSFFSARLLQE